MRPYSDRRGNSPYPILGEISCFSNVSAPTVQANNFILFVKRPELTGVDWVSLSKLKQSETTSTTLEKILGETTDV